MKAFEYIASFIGIIVYMWVGFVTFSFSVLMIKSIATNVEIGFFIMFFALAVLAISLLSFMSALTAINSFFIKHSSSGPLFNYQGIFYKMERITKKASEVLKKVYYGAFLSFWLISVLIGIFFFIKEKLYIMLLFMLPFLIAGILMAKKLFIKK